MAHLTWKSLERRTVKNKEKHLHETVFRTCQCHTTRGQPAKVPTGTKKNNNKLINIYI